MLLLRPAVFDVANSPGGGSDNAMRAGSARGHVDFSGRIVVVEIAADVNLGAIGIGNTVGSLRQRRVARFSLVLLDNS